MSKALSLDLRLRVLAAVSEGLSHRAAAARFGVSAASVSRWRGRAVVQGDPRPRALGGDRRSGRIEAHSDVILGVLVETPDITIEELRHLLTRRGLDFGYGTVQRFLVRHKMTRKKKTGHASEQVREAERAIARMFSSAGRHGATARPRSSLRTWSSSTKPGPRPTWPAPTAARREAGACTWASPTATGRPQPLWPGSRSEA